MLVRPQRKHGPKAEMNVVPYIDVMLVLLVIFMVTAPMLVQGVKIELPKVAAEALPVENERQILTLSVKADGGFYWNLGSELDVENQTDSAVDLAELQVKVGAVITRGATPRSISVPTRRRTTVVWSPVSPSCSAAGWSTWA